MDRSQKLTGPMQLNSSQDPLSVQQQSQPISRSVPVAPPPLPPRPATTAARMAYRPSIPYGGMSYNMPYSRPYGSSYSPFGAFGSFGGGYGAGYGYPSTCQSWNSPDNAFIRLAEESSRPAFQSIESLVSAVGSISMMLESTYHAVHSSYQAVLGVVENFSRLKSHLAHILSTLALVRALQWFVYRILYFLRLRKNHPSADAAWAAAANTAFKTAEEVGSSHSIWPMAVFLGLVFGAPWLLFRVFSRMAAKKLENDDEYIAVGMYEFNATNSSELSVRPGQRLIVAPKSVQPKIKGWILATSDRQTYGLIPANYVRLYQKKVVTKPKPVIPMPVPNNENAKNFSEVFGESSSDMLDKEPEE